MSYLVDHHMAVSDPFRRGDRAPHAGLMMNLTRGVFPWTAGGVALLRRELYPAAHNWTYCGLAIGADTTIKNYPGMTHSINQAYQYAAVVILGNGMISTMSEPVRLDFDGVGALITPSLPNPPAHLCAVALAGGAARVDWCYDAYGHGGYPADFQVFEGASPATVNYGVPMVDAITGLTVVAFDGSRLVYTFTTSAFADGTPHVFAVRGRNSGGVSELNTNASEIVTAASAGPVAVLAAERLHVAPFGRGEIT